MWSRKVLPALVILIAGLLATAQEATAQKTTVGAADPKGVWGWYVVRPGDTLRGLTARYFGSEDRWKENWDLNPDIADPDVIQPSQHIKLMIPDTLPEGALLTMLSNRVEDQPTPLGWTEAKLNEMLRSRDGVKTHEASSAQLTFGDGTLLMVTEQSLVFLTEENRVEEIDRTRIEVVLGQADLEGSAAADTSGEFEIIMGDVTASPRASEDSALSTRARRPESGGAQLMVYSGESDLSAAGAKVKVATGMGSSVPEGKVPSPPEKLLPATADQTPAAAARLATRRPAFSWEAVDGARGYVVEVCRDEECGALVERATGLKETSWRPRELPVEELFWRVTAVSESGLDGYASEARSLVILSGPEDTTPPEIRVGFVGPHLAPRYGLHRAWILGPGSAIEIEVEDAESGVSGWTPKIDGEKVAVEALKGPWNTGAHTLTVVATNRVGQSGETELPFIYDPDPPQLSWGAEGDPAALGSTGNEPGESLAGDGPARRGRREMKVGNLTWWLDSDLAQVVVRPQTRRPIGLEGLGSFGPEQGLWVLADDAVCPDLQNLSYELVTGAQSGEYELLIEAIDCVGNARRGRVPLVRQKKGRRR